ncbi:carboxypeptidase-like regulatory domain-containing protein [Desulfosporosinus sp. BG]|uniref:carboxypeptidase-like regulatory domain-containing protein n=1 Tax=Desulfosporosinus sp. BG TaxID=1633135 RepID=UPI00083B42D7|nr:carboxypeptidase-like regulatory domain-containing protein [Desulfosporosinus sp. BG]ODA40659.1 hypothetical protein DSBG_2556 [Desulfosporosinus sp. BG]
MANQFYLVQKTAKKVSLAVRVTDDYTLREPVGRIKVGIKEAVAGPVKNPSGYYVFTDLLPGSYSVEVASQYYLTGESAVNTALLDAKYPVLNISLTPHSAYPFTGSVALIRGLVYGSAGKSLAKAGVQAVVTDPENADKAKLSKNPVKAGDRTVLLADIYGELTPDELLMIKDVNKMCNEVIKIAPPVPANSAVQPVSLASPLKFDHPAKTPLMSVLKTLTNEKGEFVIYFRTLKANKFNVSIQVHHPDYQIFNREVEITADKQVSLGVIQLTTA